MSRIIVLIIPFILFLLACSVESEYDVANLQDRNLLLVEKKYYLKDCMVKVNFNWAEPLNYALREKITNRIGERINQVVAKNVFPLFSGHKNRARDYYVLYFSDRCEKKISMTNRLIKDYLLPDLDGFPGFSIESEIKPGFDGITPSGWWLDD